MKVTFEIPDKQFANRDKAESTVVINALKKLGIPGKTASYFYSIKGPDYLVRMFFLYEWAKKEYGANLGWLIRAIQNDYTPPEDFHGWFKKRKEDVIKSDLPIELKRIIGRV